MVHRPLIPLGVVVAYHACFSNLFTATEITQDASQKEAGTAGPHDHAALGCEALETSKPLRASRSDASVVQ